MPAHKHIDECAAITSNTVVCTNSPGSYDVVCASGYENLDTNTNTCADIDECVSDAVPVDTASVDTCTNTPGSFTLACKAGYENPALATKSCSDVDECATSNGGCATDATCTNIPGSRTCACNTGFTGDGLTCADVDECATSNGGCATDATCTNIPGSRTCACNTGFTGDGMTCADVDECATSNGGCATDATCTNIPGSRTCACNTGFTGDGLTCADVDECATSNGGCATDATCTNIPGSRTCACNTGFTGDGLTCADVDECATSNGGCATDATCTNIPGSRTCACNTGFTGDGLTCADVDECATSNGGCATDATCTNIPGSRTCACNTGFTGDGLTCADVDECATSNGGCATDATCTNIPGSRTCACNTGFTGDGLTCADVDECATSNGGCATDATCTNIPGSRTCACNTGFTGDGLTCADVDECATSNGGCATDATCTNIPGSRTCACNTGFTGDGLTCADVDECATSNGGCATDATCTNIPGSRTCACNTGFTGDGLTCADVDECATSNGGCATDATCTNIPGSRTCACNTGFTGDGLTCADIDECVSGTVSVDTASVDTCTNTPGSFTMTCKAGYEKPDLATKSCSDIDECAAITSNTVVCTNSPGSYTVVCASGYENLNTNANTCAATISSPAIPYASLSRASPSAVATFPPVTPTSISNASYSTQPCAPSAQSASLAAADSTIAATSASLSLSPASLPLSPTPTLPAAPDPAPPAPRTAARDCLTAITPVAALTNATASAKSDAFLRACGKLAATTTTKCNAVTGTILSAGSSSNIAARAGMLCSTLDLCSAAAGCSALNSGSLTGALDLCAAEGIVGGAATPLAGSVQPAAGSCTSSANCTVSAGQLCQIPPAGAQQTCSCVAGRDVCQSLGTCVSYCSLNSTLSALAELNAGVTSCDPTGTSASQCGAGETCTAPAAGSTCQRWSCDSFSQKLVQVACNGVCLPQTLSMTSAAISDDGRSIRVALSGFAAPLTQVPCTTVFDAASSALVGGASALCSTSGSTLTVQLTANATLKVGSSLAVLSPGTALVSAASAKATFAGSVQVAGCSSCELPRLRVSGPATISQPCETAGGASLGLGAALALAPIFDASASTDPSGRAQWQDVRWAVPVSVTGSGRAVLEAAAGRANALATARERLRLSLTADEATSLADSSNYALTATVTSWLGTSASATILFGKASTASKPSVTVAGSTLQSFKISGGIKASADAGTVCKGRSLEWLWTAVSPANWPGLPAAGVSGQQLFVSPPVLAVHGQTIGLRVLANYANDPASQAVADIQFTAVGSAPVAALTGPSGDVTDDQPILLNATASADPDSTTSLQRLRYTWACRREDYPTPCFADANQGDQTGTPGIWSLKAGTLSNDKLHTFTVTVSKEVAAGAAPLSATASISVRPRSAAVPFPRGSLKRQCGLSGCAAPHSTDRPLVLALVLESTFSTAAVSWRSAEVAAVSSLTAASSATDPTIPPGTHYLTVPAALLPSNRASLTIAANLSLAGATGLATTTVSLNSAPSCSLGTSASECLTSSILTSTFPNAAVSLLAQGWADAQDDSQLLRYEFGVRSMGAGGRTSDSAQQIGGSSSGTVLGLPVGNSTLYCCVMDTAGSRTCATTVVTVNPPAAGFNAAAALASVNVSALAQAGDQRTLLQAASQMSQIVAAMGGSTGGNGSSGTAPTAEQQQLVAARSATLISAILSGASLDDPEQRTQAISAIAAIASSAASIVSDYSRQMFADAALKAADSLVSGSDSGLTDLATQLCRLLGAALPTGGSSASARSSGRRSLLDTSGAAAQGSLQNLLDVARKIGNALGQQAVPGGENEAAGDSGVFVSVGALPTTTSGGSGSVGVTVTAGPATSSSTPSSTPASPAASSRRALASRRHLAQATTTTATGARAALVLSGALASGAAGYGLVLSYAPSASVALQQALAASLPSTSTLRGGLATVGWTSGASPPDLDGTISYVRLQLPAAGYDATRSGTCARYDDTTKSLATDAKPAVFESYDSATGLVTCRVGVVGSYVVVQGAQLASASVPPASQATSTTDAPPPSPPTRVPESAPLGTDSSSSGSISAGVIAGAVVGAVVGAILIAAVALVVVRRRRQNTVAPAEIAPAMAVRAVPAA
ncbi:hypothetical protein HXX76_002308 [Chlamydomonas incerta]|uniref:EGF-like domain-containing protein n=1 Tax=Chlamydomonas incerta TaxID=51695 RepID=A0A835SND8_CHLIN|nr:hypothetical protein HXX76_002308 [Chlamydomonas incerta]|eukprot:KAG2423081.1 hypothetical protein HXX76_002308 [Chlamydomonas incerta]